MKHYKYIFVILVYRNTDDLAECLESIKTKVTSHKCIVVNAFYDESSKCEVEKMSSKFYCDFINVDNKGYSFGNNRGIEYAKANYEFDYIVISNPDIVIKDFDDSLLDNNQKYDIIAPKIITASGKAQNPIAVFRSPISEYLVYNGIKYNLKFLFLIGIIISRSMREFLLLIKKIRKETVYPIYAAHGSFTIFRRESLSILNNVYDENMFLFAEEAALAQRAKKEGLKICYYEKIEIHHKEDGSMKLSNFSINDELKKSNIYYYEQYVKNGR